MRRPDPLPVRAEPVEAPLLLLGRVRAARRRAALRQAQGEPTWFGVRHIILALALVATPVVAAADRYADARRTMVEKIRAGIREASPQADDDGLERVLNVVSTIPRERFVADAAKPYAYLTTPLEIGYGQTISDPYIVTLMTAAARLPADANVLDIGTGSGYQAAVLSPLARSVWSVEIVEPLAKQAGARLRRLGYRNVTVRAGDGFAGWPDKAPFDAIIVAAGAATIPQPLIDQLKVGGRMIIPIGPSTAQELLLVVKKRADGTLDRCSLGGIMFVPLTGAGERPTTLRGLRDRSIRQCYDAPVT
ncbi:protein-L-isoaspartate(D-aspartate) O-methyltransferase [Roseomonas aeriglobus]|nr:protein-L-isoaspartate(D-aspartate) O-methyltransferase [Roseomonas aeriglobus]